MNNIVWLLFSFKGRISRQPFWIFTLAAIVIILFPAFFIFEIGTEIAENYVDIMSIIFLWPALAIQAKRWHDRDKSAWWILINFVPIIGGIWALIENGFLAGTESANMYGQNPLATEANET